MGLNGIGLDSKTLKDAQKTIQDYLKKNPEDVEPLKRLFKDLVDKVLHKDGVSLPDEETLTAYAKARLMLQGFEKAKEEGTEAVEVIRAIGNVIGVLAVAAVKGAAKAAT